MANPRQASLPEEVLRTHPHAAPFWHGLLHAALHGDERTAGNTITTIQQALALFFQQSLRRRCVPGRGRAPVDLAELIARGGTVYLLGRDDPYASASPLMTAVAEDILDTALQLALRKVSTCLESVGADFLVDGDLCHGRLDGGGLGEPFGVLGV